MGLMVLFIVIMVLVTIFPWFTVIAEATAQGYDSASKICISSHKSKGDGDGHSIVVTGETAVVAVVIIVKVVLSISYVSVSLMFW